MGLEEGDVRQSTVNGLNTLEKPTRIGESIVAEVGEGEVSYAEGVVLTEDGEGVA